MKNLSFKGYAQRKGFDPVQLPDPTVKLKQEIERTIRGMSEVRQAHREQNNQVQNYLEDKHRLEARNRDRNQDLKKSFADAFYKAEMQHYKQKVTDAHRQASQPKLTKQSQSLLELLPSIASIYGQIDNYRYENLFKKGQQLRTDLGGTDVEWKNYLETVEGMKASDAAFNEVITTHFPNASDLQRRQLQNLRGYTKLGVAATVMQENISNNIGVKFAEFSTDRNFVTKNGETYAELMAKGEMQTGSEARALLNQFKKNFIGEVAVGRDTNFLNKYANPHIDKWMDQQRIKIFNVAENNRIRIDGEDKLAEFKGHLALNGGEIGDPGQGLVDFINNGDDRGANWVFAGKNLETMAGSDDKYGKEFLDKIANKEVKKNPDQKDSEMTTIGEKWAHHLKPAYAAAHKRENKNRLLRDERLKNANVEVNKQSFLHQAEFGRPYNAQEVQQIKTGLRNKFRMTEAEIKKYIPELDAGRSRETFDEIRGKEYYLGLINDPNGNALTMAHLKVLPISLWDEASKLAVDGPNSIKDKEGILQVLDSAILEAAGQSVKSKYEIKSEAQIVINRSRRKINDALETALITSSTPGDATSVLLKLRQTELEDLNANRGIYERHVDGNGDIVRGAGGGFVNSSLNDPTKVIRGYKTSIREDSEVITRPGLITEGHLKELVAFERKVGRRPQFLYAMSLADPTRTEEEIASEILQAETGKRLQFVGLENIIQVIRPEDRKQLTDRPSLSKAKSCFAHDPEQNTSFITALIPKDRYNSNPDNPYDVITSPFSSNGFGTGSGLLGADLEQMTVGGLIQSANSGKTSSFGAFGCTGKDLANLVNTGMLSTEDKFTREIQTIVQDEKITQETTSFYADGNPEPIPGLGQAWVLDEPDKELEPDTAMALTPFVDFKQLLPGVYNELVRRTA